ncbi:hypothetical protein [Metabacillus idriensis]|uniref:hypothetical protein n=1 Tax=Metabacillus idriensis TaxID=324768 RepID=UPI003D29975C
MAGFLYDGTGKLLWDMEEEYLRTARPLLAEEQIVDLERLLTESLQTFGLLYFLLHTNARIDQKM